MKIEKRRRVSTVLLRPLLVVGCATIAVAQSITVFDVPGATGTIPVAINNSGAIAGYSTGYRGFVRESNGNIATFEGIPADINSDGTIAGSTWDSHGNSLGFVRDRNGNITLFRIPPMINSPADYPASQGGVAAINDRGDVAGYFYPCFRPCDDYAEFIRDRDGTITTFSIGGQSTSINARGDITGVTSPNEFHQRGFVRDRNGTITIFTVPEDPCLGLWGHAVSINNGGDVTGYFCDASGLQLQLMRSFLRDRDGTFTTFDINALDTWAAAINERGDVAGSFAGATGSRGFLRDHKGNVTILDMPNALATWAVGLNDRDDVTGYFSDSSGTHGFVRSAH